MGDRVRWNSNILKTFTGEGDVVTWLSKLNVVTKLQKMEDVAKLIPQSLKANALAVYQEMGKGDKADAGCIEQKLKMAFVEGDFEAYNKLRKITWTREAVDVYATEIRQLAGLVRYARWSLEKTVFMSDFPDRISWSCSDWPGQKIWR